MNAQYVDVNKFRVNNDRTADFIKNRKVKLIGNSTKFAIILTSEFVNNYTYVTITTNDVGIDINGAYFGIISPGENGSLPIHDHNSQYYKIDDIDSKLLGKSDSGHEHDTRYYTRVNIDSFLTTKSNTSHTHDDKYYLKNAIDTFFDGDVAGKKQIKWNNVINKPDFYNINLLLSVGSVDNSVSGQITNEKVGEDISIGDGLYYDIITKTWKKANASSYETMPCCGIALEPGTENTVIKMLRCGIFKSSEYDFGKVNLISNITTMLSDDFDNTIWSSNGEKINLKTSINDVSTIGKSLILYFINDGDELDSETIVLNNVDSSISVSGNKLCKKLVSVKVSDNFGVDLIISSFSNNICKIITTPIIKTYGSILPSNSDSKGFKIRIVTSSIISGNIIVNGSDKNNNQISEILKFDNEQQKISSNMFNSINSIYVGDDGVNDCKYDVDIFIPLNLIYVSATQSGKFTKYKPSTTKSLIQIVGHSHGDDYGYFDFNCNLIENS